MDDRRIVSLYRPFTKKFGACFKEEKAMNASRGKEIREDLAGRRVGPLKLHVPVSPTR
jgi:hypothetical protein